MKKMKKRHVKIGDKVKVITGEQKGKIGNILFLNCKKNLISLDVISPRIKFFRNRETEKVEKRELPIFVHISNVMHWEEKQNTASRIGYKVLDTEKKRFFKKSGNFL